MKDIDLETDPATRDSMAIVAFCRARGWSPDDAVINLLGAIGYAAMSSTVRTPRALLDTAIDGLIALRDSSGIDVDSPKDKRKS